LALLVLLAAMLAGRPLVLLAVGVATLLWIGALLRRRTPPVPGPLQRLHPLFWPILALALVAWANGPALSGDFVADDFGCLQLWNGKSAGQILQLGDVSDGIWGAPDDELRPTFVLWYKTLLSLFGVAPLPLHTANLLLHLLSCLTVYGLVRQWWGRPGRAAALAAGLLFGVMPVSAEPVAWLIGGVDVLSTLAYLLVLLLFVRFRATGRRWAFFAAVVLCVPALFTKEIVVTLPVTLLGFDLLVARPWRNEPGRWPRRLLRLAAVHLPFVLASAGFLLLRRLAFDTFAREGRLIARVPWFLSSLPTRLRWFLLPDSAAGVLGLAAAVLAMGGLVASLFWLWRHRRAGEATVLLVGFFGLVFPVVTHLPLVVTYLSPRHLYLPGAGLAIAAGAALFPREAAITGTHRTLPRMALLLLLLATFVPALRHGQRAWRTASEISRQARRGIEAASRKLPRGALLVVAGVPAERDGTLVWRFALPFALQPPFAADDLERSRTLIEVPDLYCCPLEQWWRVRMPPLIRLLEGDPRSRIDIHLAEWSPGRVTLYRGRPRRRLVRGLVEEALGKPLTEQTAGTLEEARAVVARLVDLARRSGGGGASDNVRFVADP
jgi:hypothetical protein